MSLAAKEWLASTGKGEGLNRDIVRREGGGASVFLEALQRKGFTCALPTGWKWQPIASVPNTSSSDGAALAGCAALIAVAALLGIGSYKFMGGGGSAPSAIPAQSAPTQDACQLPDCFDGQQAGVLKGDLSRPGNIVGQQPADFDYLKQIAYHLPTAERRDEFETTAAYEARVAGLFDRWKLGALKPDTKLLLISGRPITFSYNADKGLLSTYEYTRPPYAFFGSTRGDHNDGVYEDRAIIKMQSDSVSGDAALFSNIASSLDNKINGGCSPTYKLPFNSGTISFRLSPDQARQLKDRLRAYYVVSFKAPVGADKGEWCYTGSETDSAAMLIKGGVYQARSTRNYLHLRLDQLILSDGKRVLWSRSFP